MTRLIRVLEVLIALILLTGCCFENVDDIKRENVIIETNGTKLQKVSTFNENNDSFKVILENNDIDINGDNNYDKVGLYLTNDLDVILKVEDDFISVFTVDNEDQIFGNISSDKYLCNLRIEGNKILVGTTYSFTMSYGSTSWIECYEYKCGVLNKIWSSSNELDKNIIIKNYNKEQNIIEVVIDEKQRNIILDDEGEKNYIGFTEYLKNEGYKEFVMDYTIIPQYRFYDFNDDNKEELITRGVVTFSACPIRESYYCVYEFSQEGIVEIESWFNSANPSLGKKIEFNY